MVEIVVHALVLKQMFVKVTSMQFLETAKSFNDVFPFPTEDPDSL